MFDEISRNQTEIKWVENVTHLIYKVKYAIIIKMSFS